MRVKPPASPHGKLAESRMPPRLASVLINCLRQQSRGNSMQPAPRGTKKVPAVRGTAVIPGNREDHLRLSRDY